jgi:hypothetical protein
MSAPVAAEHVSSTGRIDEMARSIVAGCAVAAAVAFLRGVSGLIGFIYGAAITLGIWRGIRIVVRACLRVDVPLRKTVLAVLLVLKFPVLVLIPAGAAWLIVHRIADPFALVGGIAFVQAVILLKALDVRVLALLPQETVEALLGLPIPAVRALLRPEPQAPPVPEGSCGGYYFRLGPPAAPALPRRRVESR